MNDPYDDWKLASPDDEPDEQARADAEYDWQLSMDEDRDE